ncbi:MAG: hypothetical protein ABIR66_02080 [Saprospiraceae bacterium]
MIKINLRNSAWLILNTLLLTLFSVSCTKQAADNGLSNNTEEFVSRRATKPVTLSAKPVTLPTISLKVTINDASGNNITSDGKGDYINAINNVQAILDPYGTFAFNTFNSNKPKTNANFE